MCQDCYALAPLPQVDGTLSGSDSEEEFVSRIISRRKKSTSSSGGDSEEEIVRRPSKKKKSTIEESDGKGIISGGDSEEEIVRGPLKKKKAVIESSDEDSCIEVDLSKEVSEEYEHRTVIDELGRHHIPYPANGPSYVFLKSNTHDPSNIEEHTNDIINIISNDESLKRKLVLILILDDGADYGIRTSATMHYFGKLWIHLDLDLLIVVKNAPKDSRFNPVEHLWGYLTPKLSGMVLPTRLEGDDDGLYGVESPEVLDQSEEHNKW